MQEIAGKHKKTFQIDKGGGLCQGGTHLVAVIIRQKIQQKSARLSAEKY